MRKPLTLSLIWSLTALAILPAIFHWAAPPAATGSLGFLLRAFQFLVPLAICYCIYLAESRHLARPQTISMVFLAFLLASITNSIHAHMVDHAVSANPEYSNLIFQFRVHDLVIQLSPVAVPHSYRFLPNSIVRWMQLAHMGFEPARDLYRQMFGILLFYAIYKYARLYTSYSGALAAMLLAAIVFPVSFEIYRGQLTDPLSHLSFVLSFIFLETGDFALFLSTLLIGSLAKETILAMAGYYILFCRKESNYPLKVLVLCLASATVYFGVRVFVLKGLMHYSQVSGVGWYHVWASWQSRFWPTRFLMTAGAFAPFLALGWKETPLSLKRQVFFLLPILFISSLVFSWLHETRNYMPLVFVLAVITGNYLFGGSSETKSPPKPSLTDA
jgi:hypothetical protein